jgi:hypothetical protein
LLIKEKGYTIIVRINQGIYADVKPHPSNLIMWSTTDKGSREGPFEIPMERSVLLQEDGFSGYIVKGRRFDVGVPDAYRQAILVDYRNL